MNNVKLKTSPEMRISYGFVHMPLLQKMVNQYHIITDNAKRESDESAYKCYKDFGYLPLIKNVNIEFLSDIHFFVNVEASDEVEQAIIDSINGKQKGLVFHI